MIARPSPLRAAALLLSILAAGCVHEREKKVPTIQGAVLSRGLDVGPNSPRFGHSPRSMPGSESSTPFHPPAESRVPAPPIAESAPVATLLRGPAPRAAPAPAHRPLPAGVSLEQLAREKFLSADTTVTAATATVYVPAAYAGEVSLTGVSVSDEAAGRRTATGDAVLTLRRLTVRAARATLVIRPANEDDLQLTARGGVTFESAQPGNLVEERDLRSLLLRNDGYTPLR